MNATDLEAILRGLAPTLKAIVADIAAIKARALTPMQMELLSNPEALRKAIGIPQEPAGSAITVEIIQSMIDTAIGAALAALPVARDGDRGPPGDPGRDGTSVTLDDVRPIISEEIGRQLAELMQERATIADFVRSIEQATAREVEHGFVA